MLSPESPNAELNARIAASILACFPAELFDSTGLLRSLWLMRLTNVAEDTQGMIDELFKSERPAQTEGRLEHACGGLGRNDEARMTNDEGIAEFVIRHRFVLFFR